MSDEMWLQKIGLYIYEGHITYFRNALNSEITVAKIEKSVPWTNKNKSNVCEAHS